MTDHMHHPTAEDEIGRGNDHGRGPEQQGFWRSTTGLVTIAFLAIGAFFLVTEHRAHIIPWLPWLILLACPLLHVFMHGGHGGHGGDGSSGGRSSGGGQATTHGH